jgi:hypothetical protein
MLLNREECANLPIPLQALEKIPSSASDNWWGVGPTRLAAESLPGLSVSSDRLWNALVDLKRLRRTDRSVRKATNYSGLGIDGIPVDEWDAELPEKTHLGFEDFTARLLRKHRAKEFFLLINNFQLVLPKPFRNCCSDLQHLLGDFRGKRRGIARVKSPITLGVIVSNCLKSPTGIHMDPNHAFLQPILGEKRMRFWPLRAIKKTEIGLLDIASLKPESRVIESGAGAIIYWPSNWWHMADERSRKTRACLVLCVQAQDGVRQL